MNKSSNNFKNIRLKTPNSVFFLGILSIVMLTLLGASIYIYLVINKQTIMSSIDVNNSQSISINIPGGATTKEIAQILQENELINNTLLYRVVSKVKGFDGKYNKGVHFLNKNMNYIEIARLLCQQGKSNSGKRITIVEGLTFEQLVNKLESENLIDKNKFIDIAQNGEFSFKFFDDLQVTPQRKYVLEGYLFPDTYEFDDSYDELAIINVMLQRFEQIFEQSFYERAKELNMTIDEVITLASIIEKETMATDEREIVSSVFHNRLKSSINMRLGSCATVQYVLGTTKEVLSTRDTQVNSPYNTYINDGLPPGPICSPGKASIYAALYPANTDYLYFVADGKGNHIFSKTLNEHNIASNRINLNR